MTTQEIAVDSVVNHISIHITSYLTHTYNKEPVTKTHLFFPHIISRFIFKIVIKYHK